MKFDKYFPNANLSRYIKHYVVSEHEFGNEYKVLPSTGLVIGFQYSGQHGIVKNGTENKLISAGITGMTDAFKIFKSTAFIGTILVYFTEVGFTHFASHPANELFNMNIQLEDIFDKSSIKEVEEKLAIATTDLRRIKIKRSFYYHT